MRWDFPNTGVAKMRTAGYGKGMEELENRAKELKMLSPGKKDSLSPGRDLDVLVAAEVMEWTHIRLNPGAKHFSRGPKWKTFPGGAARVGSGDAVGKREGKPRDWRIPDYSTDIGAAWKVVARIGVKMDFSTVTFEQESETWQCTFMIGSTHFTEVADTAPLAICLAALKAVGAG